MSAIPVSKIIGFCTYGARQYPESVLLTYATGKVLRISWRGGKTTARIRG